MTSIEAFAKKGEKNMLKNMFKEEGASSDDSMSEFGSDDEAVSGYRGETATKSSMILTDTDTDCCIGLSTAEGLADDLTDSDLETSIESYRSVKDAFTVSYQQQRKKGIAHQLWPAAIILSKYIEENIQNVCGSSGPESVNILELGAGIGLCGLVCSALKFRKVILTDLPVALDLLNTNINLNNGFYREQSECQIVSNPVISGERVTEAQVLGWGCHEDLVNVMEKFDKSFPVLVIAADCVYWEKLFKPLYDTIHALVTEYNTEIIISHVKRWKKDEKFFKLCRKSLTVELLEETRELVPAPHTGIPTREIKKIYRIKKKETPLSKNLKVESSVIL